jgi:hypothetical protein
MSTEGWIALVLAVLGYLALFFSSRGYLTRQLEDIQRAIEGRAMKDATDITLKKIEGDVTKSFDHHRQHFAHADRHDIHKESMDKTLIESKFENVNQRIDALGELVESKMDNMCDRLTDLTNAIKKGNGHA